MLYKNKYRIESARHPYRDYGQGGFYFVTICSLNHQYFFGHIDETPPAKMLYSDFGQIADAVWYHIPIQFPFAELDEWQIMPNHVHGIVQLTQPETDDAPLVQQTKGGITSGHNPMHQKSLATIFRWYKGRVKYEAGKLQPNANFNWQPKFHDRIIRNQNELDRIRQYIRDNPKNWAKDKLNS